MNAFCFVLTLSLVCPILGVPTCPPPPPCARGCDATGIDGCPTCHCPSCSDITCEPGTQCQINDSSCDPKPCFGKPYCAPIEVTATPTASTKTCEVCEPGCHTDMIVDNCFICGCPYIASCRDIRCNSGYTCVEKNVTCYGRACRGEGRCVQTDTTEAPDNLELPSTHSTETATPASSSATCEVCERGCHTDYFIDNCWVCGCPFLPSCDLVDCKEGFECVEKQLSCKGYTCQDIPECVPIANSTVTTTITSTTNCPVVSCSPNCRPIVGPDGCANCDCSTATTTTNTSPNSTCEKCEPGCETDIVFGNNCAQCGCPFVMPCEYMKCEEGEVCVHPDLKCYGYVCRGLPKCISRTGTTRPPCLNSSVSCQAPCEPDYGQDGCYGSACACPRTCEDVNCTASEECRIVEVNCIRAPCFPQPQCFPMQSTTRPTCPSTPVSCQAPCEPDYGPDGCRGSICACPKTCQDVNCTTNEECRIVEVKCIRAPCFPVPQCFSKHDVTTECPMYKCAPDCVPSTGSDGCPACDCPPRCEDDSCLENQKCVLENVTCVAYPCFPVRKCVPENPVVTSCCSCITHSFRLFLFLCISILFGRSVGGS